MAPRKNAGSVFMPTKVKRLMQADKEVGKMVAEVPILMACAVEMLLAEILRSANSIRLQGTTKLLTAAHLEQVMNQNPEYVAVRPPVTGSIALHPHEFIAKYSKQSYMMQQKPFGLDPNLVHQSQQQSQQQTGGQQHLTAYGVGNPMIGGGAPGMGPIAVGLMVPGGGVVGLRNQPGGGRNSNMMNSNDDDDDDEDEEEDEPSSDDDDE